jgi:hypothetical protein
MTAIVLVCNLQEKGESHLQQQRRPRGACAAATSETWRTRSWAAASSAAATASSATVGRVLRPSGRRAERAASGRSASVLAMDDGWVERVAGELRTASTVESRAEVCERIELTEDQGRRLDALNFVQSIGLGGLACASDTGTAGLGMSVCSHSARWRWSPPSSSVRSARCRKGPRSADISDHLTAWRHESRDDSRETTCRVCTWRAPEPH